MCPGRQELRQKNIPEPVIFLGDGGERVKDASAESPKVYLEFVVESNCI